MPTASPTFPASRCGAHSTTRTTGLKVKYESKNKVLFSCTGCTTEDFLEPSWGAVYKLETAGKVCRSLGIVPETTYSLLSDGS